MVFEKSIDLQNYMESVKSCVICGKSDFELWCKLDYYEALQCNHCKMISINPPPSNEGLSKFYSGYLSHRLNDEEILLQQRKLTYQIDHDWITKHIDHGDVLDIGCSGGHFLNFFDHKKWNRLGVDIESDDAEFAKKEYDVDVNVGFFPDLSFEKKFDLLMMRGVIEHISDPIQYLKKSSELVKPGGFLFITATPAGDSFAFYVYREKWRLFTPPEHLHFFTIQLLTKKLKEFGFSLVDYHYQYEETPYANIPEDYQQIISDIELIKNGKYEQIKSSSPFLGSMLTGVWQKTD